MFFKLSLGVILASLLSGCAVYTEPSDTPLSEASLVGSRILNPHHFQIDLRIFPIKIDGNRIMAPGFRKTPILLTGGNHQITFDIISESLAATSSINANFEPGKNYALRMSAFSANGETNVWVETSDGSPVTDKVPVFLQGPDVIIVAPISK
jgi:hypothetical protein